MNVRWPDTVTAYCHDTKALYIIIIMQLCVQGTNINRVNI